MTVLAPGNEESRSYGEETAEKDGGWSRSPAGGCEGWRLPNNGRIAENIKVYTTKNRNV